MRASFLRRSGWLVALSLTTLWSSVAAAERGLRRDVFLREGYESVTLRRTANQHWYLRGELDGRRRSCLVDSGWSFTTVSTNTARFLGQTNQICDLRLGAIALTNQAVVVADLRSGGEPTSYDAVLGLDFLLRHEAVLDCGEGRLFLRREGMLSAARFFETNLFAGGWRAVRLERHEPPALTVAVQSRGMTMRWLIDSGAAWSCLDAAMAKEMGVGLSPSVHRISGPAAMARQVDVAELRDLQIGGVRQSDISVAVFNLGSLGIGRDGKLFPEVTGILGSAELNSRRAYLDFGSRQLWLRPAR